MFINPTNLLNSKIFIDVHIAGIGAFVHNNVAYLPKKGYAPLLGEIPEISLNSKDIAKRGFLDLKVMGPSVGVSYDNYSFGFFTRARVMANAKLSKDLATFILRDKSQNDLIGEKYKNENAYLSAGAWVEFGLHAGYMYRRDHYEFWNVGANLKYLVGISHDDIALRDLDLTITDTNKVQLDNLKAGYRITTPAWHAGKGIGVDIGWSYSRMKERVTNYYPNNKRKASCEHMNYKYKIGFSITDFGLIRYNSNSKVKKIEYTNGDIDLDSSKINSIESFDQEISNAGNGLDVKSKNSYLAFLPFGLSAQYDYNLENNFYINSTIIVGLIKIPYQLKRPDMLGFTLRYDRRNFGAAIPLSLYNWTYPQLGFSLRFGNNFIIGSDRIGYIFGKVRDTYGADIYLHLKFSIYKRCKRKYRKTDSIDDCIIMGHEPVQKDNKQAPKK